MPRGATVRDRPRPDYDPIGVPLGGFVAFPSVTVSSEYNDNIFATDDNTEDDIITRLRPNVDLRSNWSRHLLGLTLGADLGFYADNTDENFQDFNVVGNGRYDIATESSIAGIAAYRRLHEGRDDPNAIGAAEEPTQYDSYLLGAEFSQGFNRLNVRPGVSFNRLDYHDVDAIGGGDIDQDDRDRDVYQGTLRVGYEFSPSLEGYVRGLVEATRYDRTPDNGGVDRDNDGYGAVVGAAVDFNGIVFGDVYVGYGERTYDDSSLGDAQNPLFGGILTWNVTRLTTVIGQADYRFDEATEQDASAIKRSTAQLNVDHELLRNVILGAEASYENDRWEGISREEDTYGIGITGDYLVNRVLYLGAYARHRNRDGSGGAEDFDENVIGLRLRLQR